MTCLEMEVYRGLLINDPVPISFNQNFSYKPLAKPYHDIYQIKVYTVFYSLEIKTGTNRQPHTCQPREKVSRDKRWPVERGGLWKGGPGVLPLKFSKTCIANGAI